MYRSHNCGELRGVNAGQPVTLAGWVQRIRNFGGMIFIDLRDRYGITQLVFSEEIDPSLASQAEELGREFVVQASGKVAERSNKNKEILTGDIEIIVEKLNVLNKSKTPPFTIEDETDGGEELRMKYRFLDLRRKSPMQNLMLRHQMLQETRRYLTSEQFIEVETPFLIKSTPEGARDFVVPSRMHQGSFYALPQSPQTFKQILMVAGFDRYFQIVKCFRDEDLRADRQPEFTQIDCELSFVTLKDVIDVFSGLSTHLFQQIGGVELDSSRIMTYDDAMRFYGSDKPDLRFEMKFQYLTAQVAGTDFPPFASVVAEGGDVIGFVVKNGAGYSRRQIDQLTDFVRQPHRGMKGLVWIKLETTGEVKSPVGKFFTDDQLKQWMSACGAEKGDLLLIVAGETEKAQHALGGLRLEVAKQEGLSDKRKFVATWITEWPLFEWVEEDQRWYSRHHPFTAPNEEFLHLLETDPGKVKANAYDFVINGVEIGGGSVRIHDRQIQEWVFKTLGLSTEESREKFGFLLSALDYGAPPHGGIAYGFDRWVAMMAGADSIREVIAFPKNNAGRDIMIDAPSPVDFAQLNELGLKLSEEKK
ncbi:MAG: aspartate--tRNA ligase [Bacteroidia bacterium]